MDHQELEAKLQQIEEQAKLTLAEHGASQALTKERQRMIIALVRHIRTELRGATPELLKVDPESTVEKRAT